MKYAQKLQVVDAVLFTGSNIEEIKEFFGDSGFEVDEGGNLTNPSLGFLVSQNQYIIRDTIWENYFTIPADKFVLAYSKGEETKTQEPKETKPETIQGELLKSESTPVDINTTVDLALKISAFILEHTQK
jgi:hypothetical protein